MNITVFGGNTDTALIRDLRLKVFLKNDSAGRALQAIFPSSITQEDGELVYNQSIKTGSKSDIPLISKVQIESSTLNVGLITVAGIFVLLLSYFLIKFFK